MRLDSEFRPSNNGRLEFTLIDMRLEASPVPHHLTGLATPRILYILSGPFKLKLVVEFVARF